MMKLLNRPSVGTSNKQTREAWLREILEQIPSGKKILDAGAGELQYKKFCNHLNYVSQDFGQYDGKGNTEGLQTGEFDNSQLDIVSDIVDIPVKEETFDAIMCIEVLEHLPEPAKAIKEFSRIIKPNGELIITAPFCSLTHFAPYYYSNGFSKYWYQKILGEHGFEILEIRYNGNYFEYLAQELRRLKSVAKKYSRTSHFIKILLKALTFMILSLLKSFSDNDTGSEELLCFGLQIKAVKRC